MILVNKQKDKAIPPILLSCVVQSLQIYMYHNSRTLQFSYTPVFEKMRPTQPLLTATVALCGFETAMRTEANIINVVDHVRPSVTCRFVQ